MSTLSAGYDEGMSAASRPHYSLEEYDRIEQYSGAKHEYVAGVIYAMSGGTPNHARLAANVVGAFVAQLADRPCALLLGIRSPHPSHHWRDCLDLCGCGGRLRKA